MHSRNTHRVGRYVPGFSEASFMTVLSHPYVYDSGRSFNTRLLPALVMVMS